jgi:hypothetical protein
MQRKSHRVGTFGKESINLLNCNWLVQQMNTGILFHGPGDWKINKMLINRYLQSIKNKKRYQIL